MALGRSQRRPYLFDPSGAWNVGDALGSGATRPARQDIKKFLNGNQTTALDVDRNGTADALSDGILILRYLFDPNGQWNVADALGVRATRTTREAIEAYLNGYNPAPPPAPKSAATVPIKVLSSQSLAVPADSPSLAVDTTVQVNSDVEAVSGAGVNKARATISQALVIGNTGTHAFTRVDRTPIADQDNQPDDLRAVDTALESWDQPTASDVTVGWMPNQGVSPGNDEELDQRWGKAGLDWFLTKPRDHVNEPELGKITTVL